MDIDAIKKIHMEPGDVGLILFDHTPSDLEIKKMRSDWSRLFPDNSCMVFPPGIRFGVVQMLDDDEDCDGK